MLCRLRRAVLLGAAGFLIASSVAQSSVTNPWSGKWTRPSAEIGGASGGVTTLTQSGSSVTGSFNWGGGGSLSGSVSGNTLTGSWTAASGGGGTMTLMITADATSFSGQWHGTSSPFTGQSGSWTGTFRGTRHATSPPAAKAARYAYSFTVAGPASGGTSTYGANYSSTSARGSGTFSTRQPGSDGRAAIVAASGSAEFIYRYSHGNRLHLSLKVTGASMAGVIKPKYVVLSVSVLKSGFLASRCPQGARGTLTVTAPDRVQLAICGHTDIYDPVADRATKVTAAVTQR